MKICFGGTRVVLLFGNKAIKIGRVKPFRLFLRIILFPLMPKERNELYYEVYGRNFLMGIINYLSIGKKSNIREYDYYQKTKDRRVVPTRRIFLSGWIIIQERGENVSAQKLEEKNPFKDISPSLFPEKNTLRQFCKINEEILLADYGRLGATDILEISLLES